MDKSLPSINLEPILCQQRKEHCWTSQYPFPSCLENIFQQLRKEHLWTNCPSLYNLENKLLATQRKSTVGRVVPLPSRTFKPQVAPRFVTYKSNSGSNAKSTYGQITLPFITLYQSSDSNAKSPLTNSLTLKYPGSNAKRNYGQIAFPLKEPSNSYSDSNAKSTVGKVLSQYPYPS